MSAAELLPQGSRRHHVGAALLVATAAAIALARLAAPPPWWDEGWTLQTARNWLEHGHYGRLLDGAPSSTSLTHGLAVTIPVAASFLAFDPGFWQARLVSIAYLIAGSAAFYGVSSRLFGVRVGLLTIVLSLFFSPLPTASALLLGRQVLGEWAMVAYAAAGMLVLRRALATSAWFAPAASLLFALATSAKPQLEPFLAAAFAAAAGMALLQTRRRDAIVLFAAGLGSFLLSRLLDQAAFAFLPGFSRETYDRAQLLRATVMVLDSAARAKALRLAVLAGLPSIIALVFGARWLRRRPPSADQLTSIFLLVLSGSWLAWFVGLSAGWPRYFFPALFFATPFVALMLCDVLSQPKLSPVWSGTVGLAAVLLVSAGGYSFARLLSAAPDDSVVEVAHWLNTQTPAGARVETFESELMFLLERPYHYPSVQTHIQMIELHQRGDTTTAVAYDALAADPDYLVIGPFAATARLYEPFAERGNFRLTRQFGPYHVFERVRR